MLFWVQLMVGLIERLKDLFFISECASNERYNMSDYSHKMTQQGAMPSDRSSVASDVTIADLRFEHCRDAFGVGVARPRLSWIVETATSGWHQASYEIEVYKPDGRLHDQTGQVKSDQSVLLPWPFAPLSSRECLMVRVRVWGNDGQPSAWSVLVPVEVGLLHPDDWTARFVT